MSEVIDFRRWKRTRRAGTQNDARRIRQPGHERQDRGLVTIGVVSAELLRRLTEGR